MNKYVNISLLLIRAPEKGYLLLTRIIAQNNCRNQLLGKIEELCAHYVWQ